MDIWEIIVTIAVGAVAYHIHCEFEEKNRIISDLKEEVGQIKRELKFEQSSKKHADELYDNLLETYYKVLETYNIPGNWESLEAEKEEMSEADEDDEDGQMVEIFVKDKNGTRTEKVPAKYVNFKGR